MFSSWASRAGLFSLLVMTAGLASAQTKVGVVDMRRGILETAEIKKSAADLEAKFKPRQEEGQKLQKQLSDIQQRLQTGQGKLSPAEEADLTAQGQRRQRELQRLSDDLTADVDRDRNEVLGKAQAKMATVVKKLAEEKGLDVVVDVSTTIYFKPAMDLTSEAITAFNAANPAK